MGTRVDFYVGHGSRAEWLGSDAYDGYPQENGRGAGVPAPITEAKSERAFRAAVDAYLATRESATRPEQGWPWPWEDSTTTDCAYSFIRGATRHAWFGHRGGRKCKYPKMDTSRAQPFGSQRAGGILVRCP